MNIKNTNAGMKQLSVGLAVCLALWAGSARASTTVSSGTFTINDANCTVAGTTTTWNDTGTLTISSGAALQTWPLQNNTMANNDAIVLTGASGTTAFRFNDNDTDFMLNGAITSTATGAQTLAIATGYNGNGDRESVTFVSGIPNAGDGSALSLNITFKTQTGSQSWVNLPAVNTFTGPITLVQGSGGPPTGYLTIGGTLTRYNGNTFGSGTLNSGNYAGAIALGTATILDYASSAPQTLSGVISGVGAVQVTGTGTLTLSGTNTYTGNTTLSSGCTLVLGSSGGLKFVVTDTTANKVTGAGTATFNGSFTIDASAVTVTSGSWTLVDVTTKSFPGTFSLAGFTGPVGNVFTKAAGGQIWTFNKSTGVLSVVPAAIITSFGIPGSPGVINQGAKTIYLTVPGGTSLATLAPTFALSSGTCNQPSGSPPSPTFAVQNPATYTVIDGTTTNNYSVTVQTYQAWSNSASFYVLTTTNGANLAASALETNFPVLLRLNASFFSFSQAQTNGADIRFTTASGGTLPYEIEQWDAVNGTASIWVLVPSIRGNTNQQLIMYWGNANVASQSSGPAVFNSTNGYVCVMHMNGSQDSVGALTPTDTGTTSTSGVVGNARHFVSGAGIDCGESITSFPSGNTPITSEAWFRGTVANTEIVDWGLEGVNSGCKVQLRLAGPPHIYVDTDFGPSLNGGSTLAFSQWYHVAYTYAGGSANVYINGRLDGSTSGTLNLPNPLKMYIGGWYSSYSFNGDIDEVRVSGMARSTNWLWMEYQNQNPLQILVGNLVQPGSNFSVSATNVTMAEGTTTNLTAQAGGAAKVYWLLKQNGQQTVIAVDQFACTIAPGRVTGNQAFVIEFKAVYPNGTIQTNDIAFTVLDTIPDPVFTLVPSTNLWGGRQTMTVMPTVSNWAALVAAGATNFNYNWSVAGVAVIKTNTPGVLTLLRSQGSGPMTVTLVLDNGGTLVTNTAAITVQEPATDAWVARVPSATEKAVDNQFYARDDTGYGTIYYNGTGVGSPNSVFLKVFTNGPSGVVLYTNLSQVPSGGAYAFSVRIPAGLVTYSVQCGSVTGTTTNILGTATNLVCGDAYIIEGQSNAVTSDVPDDSSTNQWIRSYGWSGSGWGSAVPHGGNWSIGYWGWDLATNLVATYSLPICIINGAVGGTRIDQHQANPTNHYAPYGPFGYTIYADLLTRVAGANLTHGIRGLLWHQGEQDQGAGGPDGDYDYKFYQQYFVDMSAAWKQDYPNLLYYYIFQIWPNACGDDSANDMLREVQRTLPYLYSKMRIMSTLGIVPGSSCHYSVLGYLQFFNLMGPLVKQDNYGLVPATDITAPDLKQAYFTTTNRNEIALVFGQDMAWNTGSAGLFYLDYVSPASPGVSGKVASGSASGHVIKLQLTGPSTNQTITYLVGGTWGSAQSSLIYGSNGIAALTFCSVPIAAPAVAAVPPAITSLSPTSGSTNGGTVVTLTGSNFLSGATVQFGGASAAATVNSSTQITATTPAHLPGLVNVVVANTNGLSATNQFTYVLPPSAATLGGVAQTGTNLTMVWMGSPNQTCVLLMGTNVTQPRSTWTPVTTNTFGAGGAATNSVPISGAVYQRYYLLSMPYN